MTTIGSARSRHAWAGALLALCLAGAPAAAVSQDKATVSDSEQVTSTVTIKSIDPATRNVVVTTASGEDMTIKAPPEVRNFDKLKVGDKINTTYKLSVAFVLSPPNAALPADAATTTTARAAKGESPAAAVANRLVVTGAVVAVDMARHTLKLVSPQGGEVHLLAVTSPEGRKAMADVKIGDTITAYITESVMLAVEPA